MGYSARYHAASLAAVFLALAVGILIGAGIGDTVLNDTEESLRDSLENDLEEARSESDDLNADLAKQREFGNSVYPILVADRLPGVQVGVIALGDLPGPVSEDLDRALEPTGAKLRRVSVVRTPPDAEGLAEELGARRFGAITSDPERLEALGRRLGAQLARGGGGLVERTGDVLLSRSSGEGGGLDRVILVRPLPGELDPAEAEQSKAFESGIVEGARRSGLTVVAVERSDSDGSSVPFFKDRDVATVDAIDLDAGRVAMVFALLGASGDFGVKDTADRLLPELLTPSGQ